MRRMARRIVAAATAPDADEDAIAAYARRLRDSGDEVVYAGRGQSPEQVVATALQEDADAVALIGAGDEATSQVRALLAKAGAADIDLLLTMDKPGDILDEGLGPHL